MALQHASFLILGTFEGLVFQAGSLVLPRGMGPQIGDRGFKRLDLGLCFLLMS